MSRKSFRIAFEEERFYGNDFLFIPDSRTPDIEPRPLLTLRTTRISFLPPTYAYKRYEWNPSVLNSYPHSGHFNLLLIASLL